MDRKQIILSTVLAIILFTFLSCERVMILDANEKPVVVVDCMISNEPVQILKLSFSKGASKDTYEKVKDAEAKLIECGENQSKEYLFRKEADGVWILDHAAQEGQTYRLEINVPGYEQISSEPQTIIPLTVAAQREDCREHSLIQEHYHKYDYSPIYYSANRDDESFTCLYVQNTMMLSHAKKKSKTIFALISLQMTHILQILNMILRYTLP